MEAQEISSTMTDAAMTGVAIPAKDVTRPYVDVMRRLDESPFVRTSFLVCEGPCSSERKRATAHRFLRNGPNPKATEPPLGYHPIWACSICNNERIFG